MTNRFYSNTFTAALGSRASSTSVYNQLKALESALTLVQAELDASGGKAGITSLPGFPASFSGLGYKQLRVNAAESSVEASNGIRVISVLASRDIAASDIGALLVCNSASPITLTIQPVGTVAIDVESPFMVMQLGAGKVTLAAGAGVSLYSSGGLYSTNGLYAQITAMQIASNGWAIGGDRVA
jgi:hypothetical protein